MNHITYKQILINIKKKEEQTERALTEARAAEASTGENRYRRCGGLDHRDARLPICPKNYRNRRQHGSSSSSTASSVDAEQRARGIKRRKVAVSTTAIQGNPSQPGAFHVNFINLTLMNILRNSWVYLHSVTLGKPVNFAFLEALNNNTRTAFTNIVTEVVDYITELAIKSQMFAAHFILGEFSSFP
ncbi:hypothetical protein [Parasitella parasitica]|uniref:Uncharacterized protein n=1 Tax=Parasitella parasitica TaxID=35722 RepID=A0A0B7MQC0_9FUNG|nr:hypothetical protein [Parasitella parasitica]